MTNGYLQTPVSDILKVCDTGVCTFENKKNIFQGICKYTVSQFFFIFATYL